MCPISTTVTSTTTASTTTSTAMAPRTDVLILNRVNVKNVPVLTNASGREDRNFYFLMGENAHVSYSCSITFKNEHFVFGGNAERKQISQIVGCELKRVGSLTFDHFYGACTNVANNLIYLCFNVSPENKKKCRVSSSPSGNFEEINESPNEHAYIRLASNNCKFRFNLVATCLI